MHALYYPRDVRGTQVDTDTMTLHVHLSLDDVRKPQTTRNVVSSVSQINKYL